jgi:tRNA(Ile)-lysidine synthase
MAKRALSPDGLALVRAVEDFVPPALAETGCDRVLVGLSGGPDSLALTAALAWALGRASGPLAGVAVEARVVDHGLRADSAEVARRAAAQARDLGLAAGVVRVVVEPSGEGLEAAARTARYAALLDDPASLVLVAHTLDDQAETVLLGLARGSGTRSLAGMPRRQGRLLRPLLGLRRRQTEQACRDWGLVPWADPMNVDFRHRRPRVRAALGTLDGALGPSLSEALARTAELCAEDADLLDELATEAAGRVSQPDVGALGWPEGGPDRAGVGTAGKSSPQGAEGTEPTLSARALGELPAALRGRVIRDWLRRSGATDVGAVHIRAVEALVTRWHGQAGADVRGGRVTRWAGRLVFTPMDRAEGPGPDATGQHWP